ncbi:MAG: radical SAM protein [Candidatus Asgardarchaeia archaeon]
MAHKNSRKRFNLPYPPPKSKDIHSAISCNICGNNCTLEYGQRGFCGLRWNEHGRLKSLVSNKKAILYAYLDPHITNCVASWFCPAATGIGYPKYSYKPGAEKGYYNLAVFFYGCNFNCLFCQNWTHKLLNEGKMVSVEDLIITIKNNPKISCICYFGGSPEPQLIFALNVSRQIINRFRDRIIRICFEWNGAGNTKLVEKATELSLKSGGIIKFDLKAYTERLHIALTGVTNKYTLKNFRILGEKYFKKRPEVPLLTASTLLVPGYVESDEVEKIAKFISEINPEIPYSLLIFHPDFLMFDLPVTPKDVVIEAYKVAKEYLEFVHVGNVHLLGYSSFSEFVSSLKT